MYFPLYEKRENRLSTTMTNILAIVSLCEKLENKGIEIKIRNTIFKL